MYVTLGKGDDVSSLKCVTRLEGYGLKWLCFIVWLFACFLSTVSSYIDILYIDTRTLLIPSWEIAIYVQLY